MAHISVGGNTPDRRTGRHWRVHARTRIWLNGAWHQATPAFNIELCEKLGLLPLEFDGTSDSLYHPFDRAGNRHMDCVKQRGTFNDLPLAEIEATFREGYSNWMSEGASTGQLQSPDFAANVVDETRPA